MRALSHDDFCYCTRVRIHGSAVSRLRVRTTCRASTYHRPCSIAFFTRSHTALCHRSQCVQPDQGGWKVPRRLRKSQSAELFQRPAQLLCGKHRAGEACNGRAQCLWNIVADRIPPAIIVLKARGAGACHSGRLRVMPDSAVSQRCDVHRQTHAAILPCVLPFGTAVLRHINQFCGSQIA